MSELIKLHDQTAKRDLMINGFNKNMVVPP